MNTVEKTTQPGPANPSTVLLLIGAAVVVAMLARLFLAWRFHGNYDQQSYEIVQDLTLHGRNVYANTERYNYSPLWFNVLNALGGITYVTGLPSHFVVRSFLSLVDAAIAVLLFKISQVSGLPPWRSVLLFLFNPVTVLITGFHGQFDNFAVLFLVAALYIQLRRPDLTGRARALAWSLAAIAIMVKHIVVLFPLFVLRTAFPQWRHRLLVCALAVVPFLLSFLPYWAEGAAGIEKNVFGYSAFAGWYGLTTMAPLLTTPAAVTVLKAMLVMISVSVASFWHESNPLRFALLGPLLFMVLTPGIGEQYFVLPIAFGALCPSIPFVLYVLAAGIFLIGSPNNLAREPFHSFITQGNPHPTGWNWNFVWMAALAWLVYELWKTSQSRLPAAGERRGLAAT